MIPVFDPILFGDEASVVMETLKKGFISGTSPTVREFEEAFACASKVKHVVACCNGTASLHLAFMALGVKPGDEVILPNFTIISDALAVVMCGATPVFVDVKEDDWCLDIAKVESLMTARTVGIVPVHMYGHGCDMPDLVKVAARNRLWVVEDTAQAHGGTWEGRMLGSFGSAACYSFYSNKLITMGEGGAVTTHDATLAKRMRELANLSFDPRPEHRFIHTALSHNYRLSSLQAAMGIAQLGHWEELLDMRKKLRAMYQDVLSGIGGISLPRPDPRCSPSFWASTILVESQIQIPDLQRRLLDEGIDTRRFFYPLHLQPALIPYHRQAGQKFAVSESLFERGLYLPSSSRLTWDEVKGIGKKLEKCVASGHQ